MSYALPSYITRTVKILDSISSRLVLPFALKLFFTPLKFPTPSREKKILAEAQTYHFKAADKRFTAYRWQSNGPAVLLVHGWSGRGSQFFRLIEELKARGYDIITFDAPAHGDSVDKKTHLLDFAEAIDVIVSVFGQFKAAIGHSLGGMAIFNSLEKNLQCDKIVLIGSPASINNVVHDFSQKIGATDKLARHIINYIENRYSMDIHEASSLHLAEKHNPKGLIIHDLEDLDVDVSNAKELKDRWPNANLVITQGFGHRKILMEMKVIDCVLGFIEEEEQLKKKRNVGEN